MTAVASSHKRRASVSIGNGQARPGRCGSEDQCSSFRLIMAWSCIFGDRYPTKSSHDRKERKMHLGRLLQRQVMPICTRWSGLPESMFDHAVRFVAIGTVSVEGLVDRMRDGGAGVAVLVEQLLAGALLEEPTG